MREIRLHGRGGQGVVKASHIIVKAVVDGGGEGQFIPFFGVERKGSPVFGFLRISDEKIRIKSQVYHPEMLIIMDDTLTVLPATYEGFKKGGTIIMNTVKSPKELNLPEGTAKFARVDATKIAEEEFGRNIPNTAVLGAFAKVSSLVDKDLLFKEIENTFGKANRKAAERAYEETEIFDLGGEEH